MTESARHFVVIDDHPLYRDALELACMSGCGAGRVTKAASLADGVSVLRSGPADAVLLDLGLPDASGFDGLMQLRTEFPEAPVLVVSGVSSPNAGAAALAVGAHGFVRKDSSRDAICAALKTVLAGRRFPDQVGDHGSGVCDSVIARVRTLTPQQLRILRHVCQGQFNKQIAYDLDIAETTVKAHITAIFRKLGVQSRTQAVLMMQDLNFDALFTNAETPVDLASLQTR